MDPYNFQSHIEPLFVFKNDNNLNDVENAKLAKIGVFIINVKESTLRRETITKWVDSLGLNTFIFNAVDGSQMKIHDCEFNPLVKVIDYIGNYFLLDYTRHFDHDVRGELGTGMIGDALSHQLLYSFLQFQINVDYFLIMEDDAALLESPETIRKYLANLPQQFDLAFLNSESKWLPIELTEPVNDYYNNIKRQFLNAPVSYVVSKPGAAKLLAYTRNDVTRPPDDLVSNPHVLGLYTIIASNKFLFSCDYSFESDTARFSI